MSERVARLKRITPRQGGLLIGLVLLGLALALRLYRLDAQSLWLDEGSSWELSQAGWAQLLAELFNPSAAYPLYHLLLKGWMILFGASEAALRLPSALAGALAVPAIYLAGIALGRIDADDEQLETHSVWGEPGFRHGLAAALLVLLAPFAIWYSQEAKVYSLLLLSATLTSWAIIRAYRTLALRDWLLVALLGLVGLFVHRLMILLLVAAVWVLVLRLVAAAPRRRWPLLALPILLAFGLVAAMVGGLGGEQAAGRSLAGAAIPAGPLTAFGLTFVRFSLDRWPGDAPWWWLLPWLALALWGLVRALLDLRHPDRRAAAALLLSLLGVPLVIFLAQLRFTRLYEARYLIVIYPAWALLLSYPLTGVVQPILHRLYAALLAAALLTGVLALVQPVFGLFSGDPVKEQYREAISELAARVHPDDGVVLQPAYLRPLYDYYMGRFSADPAPTPLLFFNFWQGETRYGQREWDLERQAALAGLTRSFLLIAPEHARIVDPPNQALGDEYGLVGNYWRFSREQATWPCGVWRYNGAHLLCQEAPEAYTTGSVPQPTTLRQARFGEQLHLLGYTLKATTPQGPGVYRAGGTLPISLFWAVDEPLASDYSFFLHLCRDCEQPPLAAEDGPPLEGYLPTSTWLPGKPARDDRALVLPPDLPLGHYTLLLGSYAPHDPSAAGRLRVSGEATLGDDRLVLTTVEIIAADAPAAAVNQP